jgi:hypothetical protein
LALCALACAEVYGTGSASSLLVVETNRTEEQWTSERLAGEVYTNGDPRRQDMVIGEDASITVPAHESRSKTVRAFCLNRDRAAPAKGDTFTYSRLDGALRVFILRGGDPRQVQDQIWGGVPMPALPQEVPCDKDLPLRSGEWLEYAVEGWLHPNVDFNGGPGPYFSRERHVAEKVRLIASEPCLLVGTTCVPPIGQRCKYYAFNCYSVEDGVQFCWLEDGVAYAFSPSGPPLWLSAPPDVGASCHWMDPDARDFPVMKGTVSIRVPAGSFECYLVEATTEDKYGNRRLLEVFFDLRSRLMVAWHLQDWETGERDWEEWRRLKSYNAASLKG